MSVPASVTLVGAMFHQQQVEVATCPSGTTYTLSRGGQGVIGM
jgi:hypothetical protein